jgi:hypothetical protein
LAKIKCKDAKKADVVALLCSAGNWTQGLMQTWQRPHHRAAPPQWGLFLWHPVPFTIIALIFLNYTFYCGTLCKVLTLSWLMPQQRRAIVIIVFIMHCHVTTCLKLSILKQ